MSTFTKDALIRDDQKPLALAVYKEAVTMLGQVAIKAAVSGLLAAAASEIARRNPGWGGLVAVRSAARSAENASTSDAPGAGGLAAWAATRYGCRVTTTTISAPSCTSYRTR